MCFRPASVGKPDFVCPDCGEVIEETFGVYPDSCPFCGHQFSAEELAKAEAGGNPAIAGAASGGTAVPGAPAAPAAPKAPGAPAPKAPGAPSAPSAPKPSASMYK